MIKCYGSRGQLLAYDNLEEDMHKYGSMKLPEDIKMVVVSEGVTTLADGALSFNKGIKTIILPLSMTDMGREAFRECNCLEEVELSPNISVIRFRSFERTRLRKLIIPDGVKKIEPGAFTGCSSIQNFFTEENPNFVAVDGVLFTRDMKTLVCYPSGKRGAYTVPDGVEKIAAYAFTHANGLEAVHIPDSVTKIGSFAFLHCSALKLVRLPAGLTQLDHGLFFECTDLGFISLPNSVRIIGQNAFGRCHRLRLIKLPCQLERIEHVAFSGCKMLRLDVPDTVTEIQKWAFSGVPLVHYRGPAHWTGEDECWGAIVFNGKTCYELDEHFQKADWEE